MSSCSVVPARPGPSRERAGLVRRLFVLLVIVAALLLPQAPLANAAPVGGGWSRGAGLDGSQHFVGQHSNSEGIIAYCTDFERLSPPHADRYDDGNQGGFTRSDGSRLSAAENAALSYLLHRWGNTADNATAASVQLAVWAMTSPGMHWDSAGMNKILRAEKLPADVVEQARSMTRTAFAEAGPYDVQIELETPASDGTLSVIVAVKGADGGSAVGLKASAELTGPFSFSDESESTWTSRDEPQRLTIERTGLGSGDLSVTVPRTPAAGVTWLVPTRTDVQRLLTAAVVEPRDAAKAIADLSAFQPAVETQSSVARTEPGTTIHDVLKVTAGPPPEDSSEGAVPWLVMPGSGEPVSVEVASTLWGPLDAPPVPGATVPQGTPDVGSVTTRVDGPGTYTTPGLDVPSPGWYVWTETIAPEGAVPAEAAAYVRAWKGKYGITAETTFVPWTPTAQTELSSHKALTGESVTDAVTVSGFGPSPEDAPGNIVLSMYGPLTESPALTDQVPAEAPLHFTTTVPAVNGSHTSPKFAPFKEPGCYTVVASYQGDDYTNPFASAFGEPSETVCVQEPPAAATPVSPDSVPTEAHPDVEGIPGGTRNPTPSNSQRPELAQTGISSEVASGTALVLLGGGLACIQLAARRSRRRELCGQEQG